MKEEAVEDEEFMETVRKHQPINPIKLNLEGGTYYHFGISLRDYFAAKAMQGLLCETFANYPPSSIAKDAYNIAEFMLAERGKEHD